MDIAEEVAANDTETLGLEYFPDLHPYIAVNAAKETVDYVMSGTVPAASCGVQWSTAPDGLLLLFLWQFDGSLDRLPAFLREVADTIDAQAAEGGADDE